MDAATWAQALVEIRARHEKARRYFEMSGVGQKCRAAHADRATLLEHLTLHAQAVAELKAEIDYLTDTLRQERRRDE
jgi:hypothetical protein